MGKVLLVLALVLCNVSVYAQFEDIELTLLFSCIALTKSKSDQFNKDIMTLKAERGIDEGKLANKIGAVMLEKCIYNIPEEELEDL
jgi:hypothetical protein